MTWKIPLLTSLKSGSRKKPAPASGDGNLAERSEIQDHLDIRQLRRRVFPRAALVGAFAVLLGLLVFYMFNASQPGHRVEGCPATCAVASARRPGPLRVMDLNMLHGFPDFKDLPARVELIAQEVRRLDADVLLLEEVPWTIRTGSVAKSLAAELGYNYLYYRASGNKALIFFEEGEAILSRFRLQDSRPTVMMPPVDLFERRVALSAIASTPWGDLTLVVTHLTDKAPQKNLGQARSLLSFVESLPGDLKVVAGDFNATEASSQIRLLSAAWTDTFRLLHPDEAGLTCCVDNLTAGPAEPLEKRIDYVFLAGRGAKSARLVSAQRVFDRPFPQAGGWQWASDHIGLLLELQEK
jgi:endonuclease/exonuclease/phosphatase family metal-dependent hydrolase